MREVAVGARVGAILGAENNVIRLIGFGVRLEDAVPETAAGFMARLMCASEVKNPQLMMDDGTIVWGCECWWGDEALMKEKMAQYVEAGWTVEPADLEAAREGVKALWSR